MQEASPERTMKNIDDDFAQACYQMGNRIYTKKILENEIVELQSKLDELRYEAIEVKKKTQETPKQDA